MKKKVSLVCMVGLLLLSLAGCGSRAFTYQVNLGYDFQGIHYQELIFKVYHSNTENHMWKLLAELPCTPTKGHFADIRVDGTQNQIAIVLQDNYFEEDKDTKSYFTNEEATYKFDMEGFDGTIWSYKSFEIRNVAEEQFYRLYPIRNEYGSFFPDLDLAKPYDVDNANMDNLLITITIVR